MNRAPFLFIWLMLVAQIANMSFSSKARGDNLNFRGNFSYENIDTDSTSKTTGQSTSSSSSKFDQRYNLGFSKSIYPLINLNGGALYDLSDTRSTTQDVVTKSKQTLFRPFVNLNLTNPIYSAGVGYRGTQRKDEGSDISDTQFFRNEYNTFLRWRPDKLPEMRLYYLYTNTYNDPITVDSTEKLFTFNSSYDLGRELRLNYAYTGDTRENNIAGTETLTQDHDGSIDYSHSFFNRRLNLNTGYKIHYNSFRFPTTGTVDSPLLRSAGLLSLDNTPDDGPALVSNPALIDGNLTTSAGINLGLNGDETTLTNMGLDFGTTVSVSKIYVWVDRRVSQTVANSFSWSIYTSPDNTDTSTWTFVATVFPASFGTLDNRFEISFNAVNTRFVKVVTRPILSTVSGASAFPDIFVTEMQAFNTVSGATIGNKTTRIDHRYNLGLTGKISDKAFLGYNMFYTLSEQDPVSEKRTELFNSVFFNYKFNRIFSGNASVSRSDVSEEDVKKVTDNFAVSLKAAYMETLAQTLSYSGTRATEDGGSSSTDSLLLRTLATLYEGWSAYLDLGYNQAQDLNTPKLTSTTIRSGTNFVPNDKITINLSYSITEFRKSDGSDGQPSDSQLDIQAFILPFRALSFNLHFSQLHRGDTTATLYDYSANWSPFHDGALQFFFSYNETLRPEDDAKVRAISPGLKWIVSRHIFWEMSYNISQSETRLDESESKGFVTNLRVSF